MWQHEYGAKYVCRRWLKFLLLNRIDWYEAWAHWTGCKMSAGDCQFFSSALLSNPAQSCKNQGSSIKILLYYVSDMCLWLYALVRPVWSEFLLLGTHQFCLQLAQMGNTTSAIGVLESLRRIFLRKCWFILSRLYLCISFSVFEDLGLWPLWAIKVVTRQVWTFRQDIWRPIWEKFFLSYHFLILRRIQGGVVLKVTIVFKSSTQCENEGEAWILGKLFVYLLHTNLSTIYSMIFVFNILNEYL